MLADYHVHSEFSDDSVFPVPDVCALAVERGIGEICFTDHVDYGIKPDVDEFLRDPSHAAVVEGTPSPMWITSAISPVSTRHESVSYPDSP